MLLVYSNMSYLRCIANYKQSPDNFQVKQATAQAVLFFEVTLMNRAKSKMTLLLYS